MIRIRPYFILILVILSASCKKEYSSEGSTLAENAWEFHESEHFFGGPVDSAFFIPSVDQDSLVIYGSAEDNGNDKFYLNITALSIHVGSYTGAGIQLHYSGAGSGLLNSDISGITIIIDEIDGEKVKGTFSGTFKDSLNEIHTIADGKFQCRFNRREDKPSKNTLTVWTKEMCNVNNTIEIRVANSSKFITSSTASQPSCGDMGAASFSLEAGNYSVAAICGNDTLTYQVSVNDACTYLEVGLNQDYLPLKKTSFWEYSDVHDQGETQVFTAESEVDFNGLTYTKLVSTRGETYYFRKLPHIYYQYRELNFQDFVSNPPTVELVILKDNLMKGGKWETEPLNVTISGVVQKIKLVSTIVDRDYSDIINGVEYHNLIKVNTELFFSPNNGESYAISGSAFNTVFALGKGIVSYNDFDINIEWGIKSIFLSP